MDASDPAHSIERINNDGPYEPRNCRWATNAEQNRNRRDTVRIEIDGDVHSYAEWAQQCGVSHVTIRTRFSKGVRGKALLAAPIERYRRHRKEVEPPAETYRRELEAMK